MHRYESKLIQMIVEEVLSKLNPRYMKVATYPVGIDSQVKDIISMLRVGTNEVRICWNIANYVDIVKEEGLLVATTNLDFGSHLC